MKNKNIKKLTLTAAFAAIAILGSFISFPIFGSKCAPIQHLVNIICAVFLGPWYGLAAAITSSLIRNLLGIGTLLAFPGSMFGAFFAGILYKYGKKLPYAYIGEIFGTGILGALCAYPIAKIILGNSAVALFTFVIPFLISTCAGTFIAVILTLTMEKIGFIKNAKNQLS